MNLIFCIIFMFLAGVYASAKQNQPRVPPSFKLRIKSIGGENKKFNGFYMNSFHTGAGLSVPTFSKSAGDAAVFKLNDTQVQYQLQPDISLYLQFGQTEDLYAEWGSMTLNVPRSPIDQRGFRFNSRGWLVNHQDRNGAYIPWSGWRVCRWVHEVPQLYWSSEPTEFVPCNCQKVHLVAV